MPLPVNTTSVPISGCKSVLSFVTTAKPCPALRVSMLFLTSNGESYANSNCPFATCKGALGFTVKFPDSFSTVSPPPTLSETSPLVMVIGSASLSDRTPGGKFLNPSEETKGGVRKGIF
ncbi:putative E4 [Human mastadenovirus D]|uniref:Putative E4 n=1 Tax=Human mastadenovirus D TaxID=130310 RepID=X4YXP2_9ADEN|nr:putative E4 [Human mastadenovirus D]